MNRNSKSHFSASDNRINIGRSKFNRDSWYKTTFNVGDLVPFYVDEVLPGDTFEMKTSLLARLATPLFPVMDNAYLDTYFFFVPNRLVWDHWKAFNGENDVNAWTQTIDYSVPVMPLADAGQFSLADYFGLPLPVADPTGADALVGSVNALPFRAYQLIWNEWFRDQNLQDPVLIDKSDDGFANRADMIKLRKVNKFHDYFTSCLPAPQKGAAVQIPGLDGMQVVTSDVFNDTPQVNSLRWAYALNGSEYLGGGSIVDQVNIGVTSDGTSYSSIATSSSGSRIVPANLETRLLGGASIDALRTAFQIQKLLWRDANGGTRYTEILRSHFGVVSPDARLQRPEYLGGKRTALTMNQVIQQSAAENEPTPLGNTGAYSKTVDSFDGFTKSFTEHGYLIGVCCVRTDHTYQQGINRMWLRSDRFDFYYPELAHIGNQPVYTREIFGYINNADDVFGYQEAWAEYRYRPSYVTGSFRSNIPQGSLDAWHYADDYDSQPYLSAEWIEEPIANMNRTLAVAGTTERHEQILLDMFFNLKTTRPMPMYSVPGLVDHF